MNQQKMNPTTKCSNYISLEENDRRRTVRTIGKLLKRPPIKFDKNENGAVLQTVSTEEKIENTKVHERKVIVGKESEKQFKMKKDIENQAGLNIVSVQDRLEKARMNDKKVQQKNYGFNQEINKNNTLTHPANDRSTSFEKSTTSHRKILGPVKKPIIMKNNNNSSSATLKEHASTKNAVTLTDLTLNSSGQYKCEVSTGAPFFRTNYLTSNLTVISLPSQGPEIVGFGTHYALGENVTANCTAWPSVPEAKLHWTVNNKTVQQEYVIHHKPYDRFDSRGTPTTLGLRLELDSRHIAGSGGVLRLRCVSYVGSKKLETERTAKLTHANNQRYSAGDLRNRASLLSLSSCALLTMILLT